MNKIASVDVLMCYARWVMVLLRLCGCRRRFLGTRCSNQSDDDDSFKIPQREWAGMGSFPEINTS